MQPRACCTSKLILSGGRSFKLLVKIGNRIKHESSSDVTPADVYFGRQYEIVSELDRIKRRTMRKREKEYLAAKAAWDEIRNCLLAEAMSSPKRFDDVQSVCLRLGQTDMIE